MSKTRPYWWLIPVAAQHAAVGSVTSLIVAQQWAGVFLAAFLMQLIWWINIGQRMDRHGRTADAVLYCLVSAAGIAVGGWFWR